MVIVGDIPDPHPPQDLKQYLGNFLIFLQFWKKFFLVQAFSHFCFDLSMQVSWSFCEPDWTTNNLESKRIKNTKTYEKPGQLEDII